MGGTSVKKELEKSQSTLEAATIDLQAKIEENGTRTKSHDDLRTQMDDGISGCQPLLSISFPLLQQRSFTSSCTRSMHYTPDMSRSSKERSRH
jgi:hypothetical protein